MSDIIKLLPESVANQIAAGEVVQRPASVVKELLENSIDAGSTNIKLIIKDAGKALIQVQDNGKGMSGTDARMCFERHATSKITRGEDLFAIRTMGFRGEAMASIAAVAQVELNTRLQDDELGTKIIIEGSELKCHEPVACQQGTCTLVKNLFYNVPARRNFLKSNPVETRHIIDEFKRVTLAYPEVGFSLYRDDIEDFSLKGGKLSQRIVGLFGKNYQEQLVPCEEGTDFVQVRGYVGKPQYAKKSRGDQYFFANNRFIRSNYLSHAVTSAYKGLIGDDQFPFFVLFIDIDPRHIDINVHPTKTEIKFDDEKSVYAIVKSAVIKSLGEFNISPSIDFSVDVNYRSSLEMPDFTQQKRDHQYQNFRSEEDKPRTSGKDWQKIYESAFNDERFESLARKELSQEEGSIELTFSSKTNAIDAEGLTTFPVNDQKGLFQINNTYIVSKIKSGLMFIDQQAAHERILFEKYLKKTAAGGIGSQQLLFPETIEISPDDLECVRDLDVELKKLGFSYDIRSKNAIVISGVPMGEDSSRASELFKGVLDDYKNNLEPGIEKVEGLARSLAKYSAIRRGKILDTVEMQSIVDNLFASNNPNYSPAGELTFYILGFDKIERFFSM